MAEEVSRSCGQGLRRYGKAVSYISAGGTLEEVRWKTGTKKTPTVRSRGLVRQVPAPNRLRCPHGLQSPAALVQAAGYRGQSQHDRKALRGISRGSGKHKAKEAAKTSTCASWERGLLVQLHALLQGLSSMCRRAVLAGRLSQRQRVALERWMLAREPSSTSAAKVRHRSRPDHVRAAASLSKIRRKQASCLADDFVPLRSVLTQCCDIDAALDDIPPRGLVRHVRRDTKECYYSAIITVGRLRLLTRECRDREVVASYHEALTAVQKRMAGVDTEAFEPAFRLHVDAALRERGLEAKAMGLRFCVCLAALWLPRPLLTSPFGVEGQALDAGLSAWRRLGEARGRLPGRGTVLRVFSPEDIARSWARIRAAYLDIMEEAGHCRERVAGKLAGLEAQQRIRQEVQLRRWNCARMAAEEKRQRQLCRPLAPSPGIPRIAPTAEEKRQRKEQKTLNAIDRLLMRWERRKCGKQRHALIVARRTL